MKYKTGDKVKIVKATEGGSEMKSKFIGETHIIRTITDHHFPIQLVHNGGDAFGASYYWWTEEDLELV